MTTLHFCPDPIPVSRNSFYQVHDLQDRIFFRGNPRDVMPVVAQLVVGYGHVDHAGLRDAVARAVNEFGTVPARLSRADKEKKIRELREKNDKGIPCNYSRQCNICISSHPDSRAVLTACGHTACMACVLQIEKNGRLNCPFCRKTTGFMKLHEEREEEDEVDKNDNDVEEDKKEEKIDDSRVPLSNSSRLNSSDNPAAPTAVPIPPTPNDATTTASPNPATPSVHTEQPPRVPTAPQPTTPTAGLYGDYVATYPTVPTRQSPSTRTVFIGNIPHAVAACDLERLFRQAGRVLDLYLPIDRDTGLRKGFAYCLFVDVQSARRAIAMFNGYGTLTVRMGP